MPLPLLPLVIGGAGIALVLAGKNEKASPVGGPGLGSQSAGSAQPLGQPIGGNPSHADSVGEPTGGLGTSGASGNPATTGGAGIGGFTDATLGAGDAGGDVPSGDDGSSSGSSVGYGGFSDAGLATGGTGAPSGGQPAPSGGDGGGSAYGDYGFLTASPMGNQLTGGGQTANQTLQSFGTAAGMIW